MDEPNIYGSRSNEGRRVSNESDKITCQPVEQDDNDRQTTRRERRVACRCRNARTPRRRRRRRIVSQNPFIIFYLEKYFESPGKRVTEVAKEAGKEWCAMSDEDRQKYIRLAEREKQRRRRGPRRRRR